jgi:hypothetical protein
MITNLIVHATKKNDQPNAEFGRKISELMAENKADASKFPWIGKFAEWR